MKSINFCLIEKWVARISVVFNTVAMWLLVALAALDTADLFGRYFLNMPIQGTLEISEILLACVVLFAWGPTQLAKGHVSVRFVIEKCSTGVRNVIDLITSVLLLALMVVLVWQGIEVTISYWSSNRLITTIEWPQYLFQTFVPIGGAVFCLVLLIQVFKLAFSLRKGD